MNNLLENIKAHEAVIDCVFLCFSSDRFSTIDQNIVKLISEYTTPEFQKLIKVIITHSPTYILNEKFLADVKQNLNKIIPTEEFASIKFLDLLDFQRFNGEARLQIDQEWSSAKNDLQTTIRNCKNQINVNKVKKYNKTIEVISIYYFEIVFCLLFFTLIVVMSLFFKLYSIRIEDNLKIDKS